MRITNGIDVIDISLIKDTLNDPRYLQKVLLPGDTNRNTQEHIAGRIALKEATIKAVGMMPGSWHDIQITTLPSGAPEIFLTQKPINLHSISCSISHHGNIVVANVVALFNDKD